MTKVIAALDASLAARPVLQASLALGKVLGAEVEAVHVAVGSDRVPRSAAAEQDVTLHIEQGPVPEALIRAAQADDVRALVMGARGSPLGRHSLGSTAFRVATSLTKPLLAVPPDAARPGDLRNVLVPLGGRATPHAPREIIELAKGVGVDLVVLHVLEEESLPLFTDQPQHEHSARMDELLRRYVPWGIETVRFEVRVGRCEELVPLVAAQEDVDAIALGWAQELAPDRAPVVRAVLERSHVPVLLVPVQAHAADAPRSAAREDSWSSLQSSPA